MSNNNDSKKDVVVKKVKPFPFGVDFEGHGGERRRFEILELNLKGLIVNTQDELISAGDQFLISFDLPALKYRVQEYVTVMKTYDQVLSGPKSDSSESTRHLAEVQFTDLSDLGRRKIITFLVAIKAPGFR